jgi:PTH1 family peptidyl-tRNA hydrolase
MPFFKSVMMKYLIAGLGNIGIEYENTRHNIGFEVLQNLATEFESSFKTERLAKIARIKYKSRIFLLVQPTTYMNLSGRAVKYWMDAEKIGIENVLIVTDDLALDTGKLRMRKKGSPGSHNGLEHITETLGSNDFARLRFGIGNDFRRGFQADFVLSQWSKTERSIVDEKISVAAEMVLSFGTLGVDRTMNLYNNK